VALEGLLLPSFLVLLRPSLLEVLQGLEGLLLLSLLVLLRPSLLEDLVVLQGLEGLLLPSLLVLFLLSRLQVPVDQEDLGLPVLLGGPVALERLDPL
jgi:hypothetical protein